MKEQIYTIPLNDHFSKNDGCPLCSLFDMMEKNEIERITGASMMEPDIRVKTNEEGFCHNHFEMMAKIGKRLPVALILQSHLEEVNKTLTKKNGTDAVKFLDSLDDSCYVCNRIENNMDSIYKNLFYLYKNDENFARLVKNQDMFCLVHYKKLLEYGAKNLHKKEYPDFAKTIKEIQIKYMQTLQEDIDWFCKKFDYRFKEESWKNSKDSIERTIYTLTGKKPEENKDISI